MIIPIITSLKSALEKNKIPALRELMLYLRVRRPRAVWLPPAPQPPLVTQDPTVLTIGPPWLGAGPQANL